MKIEGLLTVEQFADAVGQRPKTIRKKIWRREIEFVRIGRSIRFRPEYARELIERSIVPPLPENLRSRVSA